MKKIAVITSGLLPMPAIRGGAIETLLQYIIDYNEKNKDFLYDIYCIYDNEAQLISKKYQNSKFNYISFNKVIGNIYYNFCRVVRKLGCNDPNFQRLYINNVCKKLKNKEYYLILIESDNHFVLPIKKVTKVPIVLYLHNDKLNGSTKNAKEIFDACYKIITVSDYIKNRVCEITKTESGKVITILNGIDTNKFNLKNRTEIRENFRKQYGISSNDFVFLFTGRFEPNKGVLELIKAFNQINNKNCKLLILGGSFYSSNKVTKYVKKVKGEASLNKNIIFTGYINHDDIPKYHAMSDCMVSPSQWEEPAGLINQEALTSGLPVITSHVGGVDEYTKNTLSILIDKNDDFIKNLSSAMENLMKNDELQQQMRDSGLKVSSYFSSERYCEDLKNFLKEIM